MHACIQLSSVAKLRTKLTVGFNSLIMVDQVLQPLFFPQNQVQKQKVSASSFIGCPILICNFGASAVVESWTVIATVIQHGCNAR